MNWQVQYNTMLVFSVKNYEKSVKILVFFLIILNIDFERSPRMYPIT